LGAQLPCGAPHDSRHRPQVDYAFKHLFGRDSTRLLLVHAINSVLSPAPGHAVIDLELRNPFNPKETSRDKLSILDITARDQAGRQFNVEMQMLVTHSFANRVVYYAAKLHQQQLQEGDDYHVLRPTISICFINDLLFPDALGHHLRFRILEEQQRFPLSNDLEFHVLELPKFTKKADELDDDLDRWLYFLRHAEMIDTGGFAGCFARALIRASFGGIEDADARRAPARDLRSAAKSANGLCLRLERRSARRTRRRTRGRSANRAD
jgi:hypothetical protein